MFICYMTSRIESKLTVLSCWNSVYVEPRISRCIVKIVDWRLRTMAKTFEQRIRYLEKIIKEFFSGSEKKAKRTTRAVKRKAGSARKAVAVKVTKRKTAKQSRRA